MSISASVVSSLCVNNVNLTAFLGDPIAEDSITRQRLSHTQAQQQCSEFDGEKFTLGPIENALEYNTLTDFLLADNVTLFPFDPVVTDHFYGFYIGLEALSGQQPGGGDTTVFSFIEPTANQSALEFYHVERGEFPWSGNEPNNGNGGTQTCAQILFFRDGNGFRNGQLDDVNCNAANGFICRGPCFEIVSNENDDETDDPLEPEEENNGEDEVPKERVLFIYLFGMIFCCVGFFLSACYLFYLRSLLKAKKVKFDSLRLSWDGALISNRYRWDDLL